MELIVIGAALIVGLLLLVLGRRRRKRTPEGSVFDAAGGSSFRVRKPAGSRPGAGGDRLADLGRRRTPGPAVGRAPEPVPGEA
ncbi:MAG TPA: hypothetical protein VE270_02685, partial [Thermoleophilaceae bacterium]|nr:hypothetical protein [Thermoleophilaceae bacterium]